MCSTPVIASAVETLTLAVIAALARGEEPTAPVVRFLLRRYAATGRDDIRRVLEPALTRALDAWPRSPRDEFPDWLMLFSEAVAVSDDERVRDAAASLAASLRESWGGERRIANAAASVDACLRANAAAVPGGSVQASIDELERLVSAAYEPGEGLSRSAPGGGSGLGDHVRMASALLTAYELTSRLPYSMLAEELMQFAERSFPRPADTAFSGGDADAKIFALSCEVASVLLRLAALHGSDDYRSVAVVAPGADYGAEATRILLLLAPSAAELGLAGAVYGLAASGAYPAP